MLKEVLYLTKKHLYTLWIDGAIEITRTTNGLDEIVLALKFHHIHLMQALSDLGEDVARINSPNRLRKKLMDELGQYIGQYGPASIRVNGKPGSGFQIPLRVIERQFGISILGQFEEQQVSVENLF